MNCMIVIVALLLSVSAAWSQEMVTTVSNTTPNCRDGSRAVQQVCLPEGKELASWSYDVVSKAGNRADVESIGPVQGRPNCLQITTVVEPSGEDCLKLLGQSVCNCRGRGWLELRVHLVPK